MKQRSSPQVLVSQFFVAGLIYSDYGNAKLKRGGKLSLVKQPDNPFDATAIRIYTAGRPGVHIGFVPRTQKHEIIGFRGTITHAVIHAYEPMHATHRRVLVNVYGKRTTEDETNVIC